MNRSPSFRRRSSRAGVACRPPPPSTTTPPTHCAGPPHHHHIAPLPQPPPARPQRPAEPSGRQAGASVRQPLQHPHHLRAHGEGRAAGRGGQAPRLLHELVGRHKHRRPRPRRARPASRGVGGGGRGGAESARQPFALRAHGVQQRRQVCQRLSRPSLGRDERVPPPHCAGGRRRSAPPSPAACGRRAHATASKAAACSSDGDPAPMDASAPATSGCIARCHPPCSDVARRMPLSLFPGNGRAAV